MRLSNTIKRIKSIDYKSLLLVQSLRVGIVLLIFLFVIYIAKPQRASFFSTVKTDEFELIEGSLDKIEFKSNLLLTHTSKELMVDILADEIIVNDYRFIAKNDGQSGFCIIFSPLEEEGEIFVSAEESTSKFSGSTSSKSFSSLNFVKNSENQTFDLPLGSFPIDTTKKELDIDCSGGLNLHSEDCFSIYLKGFNVYVHGLKDPDGVSNIDPVGIWTNESVANHEVRLMLPHGGHFVTIGTLPEILRQEDFPTNHRIRIFSPEINEVTISSIGTFTSEKSNGEISVYYNPEPTTNTFTMQALNLTSNEKTITALVSCNDKTNELAMSGYSDQIELAGNSLLPAFISMIKDNAILPPTLFVTIIVGAISLIKIHKDEKKEKGKMAEETAKRLGVSHK